MSFLSGFIFGNLLTLFLVYLWLVQFEKPEYSRTEEDGDEFLRTLRKYREETKRLDQKVSLELKKMRELLEEKKPT